MKKRRVEICIRCSVCEQKDEQKEQSEQMDDFNLTKHVHNTEHVNTEL